VWILDVYRGRVTALLDNIRGWDSEQSHFIPPSSTYIITVHNGYAPSLDLKVHSFIPYDETLLHHILWRVTGKPGFNQLPSTFYGLKEEPAAEILDEYIDEHLRYVIHEGMPMEADGPCSQIHVATIKSAYDYSYNNKNLVANSSPETLISLLGTTRAYFFRRAHWFGKPYVSGWDKIFSSIVHGGCVVTISSA
jgi:hypothetical protein